MDGREIIRPLDGIEERLRSTLYVPTLVARHATHAAKSTFNGSGTSSPPSIMSAST
jgi:hypothetical protein